MTVPTVKSIELSPGAKYLVIGLAFFTLGLAIGLTVSALNQPSEAPRRPTRVRKLVDVSTSRTCPRSSSTTPRSPTDGPRRAKAVVGSQRRDHQGHLDRRHR